MIALGKHQKLFVLDNASEVNAWVKNDHIGFEVFYIYRGVVRKYRPDFIIRLSSGDMLALETKGRDRDQDRTKRQFLDEWVKAVNAHGGFGQWSWDVSMNPGDIHDILARHTHSDSGKLVTGLPPSKAAPRQKAATAIDDILKMSKTTTSVSDDRLEEYRKKGRK